MAFSGWKEIAPDDRAAAFARDRNLPMLEANLLSHLLHPEIEPLYFSREPLTFPSAEDLPGLREVAAHIAGVVKSGRKIMVHGDYDTDGLMGTTILLSGLRALGATVSSFIPSRFDDGYGLSAASVEEAEKQGAGLVLTVDCGTNARDIQLELKARGIDLVVTDHHIPEDDNLVDCPIVNPYFGKAEEPKTFAGATVGYLLLREIARVLGANLPEGPFVRLCGIATISDVVPISPFNWKLCRRAFEALKDTPSPGLTALLRKCPKPPYRSHHIAYYLAPRLNAAGRMEDAGLVLEILLEKEFPKAEMLVEKLESLNETRRFLQGQMAEEIEKHFLEGDLPFIFCASDRFHLGLLGPVASKLSQEKNKTVFLIAVDGENATGSARSLSDCDVTSLLRETEGIFKRLGGHERAAGFTMETRQIGALKEFLDRKFGSGSGPVNGTGGYFMLKPEEAVRAWEVLGSVDPIEHSIEPPFFAIDLGSLPAARVIKDKHLVWNMQLPGGNTLSAFYFDAMGKISGLPGREGMIVGRLLPDKLKTNPNCFFEVRDII